MRSQMWTGSCDTNGRLQSLLLSRMYSVLRPQETEGAGNIY